MEQIDRAPRCAEPSMSSLLRLLPNLQRHICYPEKAKISVHSGCAYNPARHAERICGVEGAKDCASFNAGHPHRYEFVVHFLALAVIKALYSQTYTPVTKVPSASEGEILSARLAS